MRRPGPRFRPFALWRARLALRRRPLVWWAVVIASASVVGLSVSGAVEAARAEARRWGPPVPVVVAAVDLAPGAVLGADTVLVETWPAEVVPRGALRTVPGGAVVGQPIAAGEAVVTRRLDRSGLVATTTRAVAIPTGPGRLGLRPGDRVDVLATFDPLVAPAGEDPTVTVARAAVVVRVGAQAVTIAVAEDEAPRVAFALAQSTITLAQTPPGTVPADGRPG